VAVDRVIRSRRHFSAFSQLQSKLRRCVTPVGYRCTLSSISVDPLPTCTLQGRCELDKAERAKQQVARKRKIQETLSLIMTERVRCAAAHASTLMESDRNAECVFVGHIAARSPAADYAAVRPVRYRQVGWFGR